MMIVTFNKCDLQLGLILRVHIFSISPIKRSKQAKGSLKNEETILWSAYGHQIHAWVPFKSLVPNPTGIALGLVRWQ